MNQPSTKRTWTNRDMKVFMGSYMEPLLTGAEPDPIRESMPPSLVEEMKEQATAMLEAWEATPGAPALDAPPWHSNRSGLWYGVPESSCIHLGGPDFLNWQDQCVLELKTSSSPTINRRKPQARDSYQVCWYQSFLELVTGSPWTAIVAYLHSVPPYRCFLFPVQESAEEASNRLAAFESRLAVMKNYLIPLGYPANSKLFIGGSHGVGRLACCGPNMQPQSWSDFLRNITWQKSLLQKWIARIEATPEETDQVLQKANLFDIKADLYHTANGEFYWDRDGKVYKLRSHLVESTT